MNEIIIKNMEIINRLNQVEGFNPSAFLRKIQGENGEEQQYLDVKYRKLWFRLKYPNGKITKRIVKLDNDFAIIESKVYLDRNDAEESYISCAMAQRWRSDDDIYGKKYVETAETAAVGRALADAGFGIQFSEPGEDRDNNPVDAPVSIRHNEGLKSSDVEGNSYTSEEKNVSNSKDVANNNKKALNTSSEKSKLSPTMEVEELMNIMSLDDAKNVVISTGYFKGKTLGQLCIEKPSSLDWYADKYKGNDNILKTGAIILLEAAKVRG